MIPCTQSCIYQDSGSCNLKRAASRGNAPVIHGDCAYLIRRAEAQSRTVTADSVEKAKLSDSVNRNAPIM